MAVILVYNKIKPDIVIHTPFYVMFDPQITPNDDFEKSLQENLFLIPVDVSSSALIPVKDIFGVPSVPSYVILDWGEKVATAAFTTSAR